MTDYESIQKRRSVIVGIFVIVAAAAFFWMIFKFGDLPVVVSRMRSYQVWVQFPSASGVARDTPVRFCGYQIGRVTEVKPPKEVEDPTTGEYYHQIVVVMSIDKQYDNIPTKSQAKLLTRGLGSSFIEIKVPPKHERDDTFLHEGSRLQGSTGMANEFFPEESSEKLEELIRSVGEFVKNANEIVGDQANKESIKTSLANLAEASKRAGETLDDINRLTTSAQVMVEHADANIATVAGSMVATSEKLDKAMTQLEAILAKINAGEGTAGKLVNDGRLYEEMLESGRQLQLILQDIRKFVAESREKGVPLKLK